MLSTLLQSRRMLYGAAIILWLVAGAAGALVLYLTSGLRTMQLHFHHARKISRSILLNRLVSADTVLDSFAAFHTDADLSDRLAPPFRARCWDGSRASIAGLPRQPAGIADPVCRVVPASRRRGILAAGAGRAGSAAINGQWRWPGDYRPDGSGALMIWRVADAG